jgi:hypothetical protein
LVDGVVDFRTMDRFPPGSSVIAAPMMLPPAEVPESGRLVFAAIFLGLTLCWPMPLTFVIRLMLVRSHGPYLRREGVLEALERLTSDRDDPPEPGTEIQ